MVTFRDVQVAVVQYIRANRTEASKDPVSGFSSYEIRAWLEQVAAGTTLGHPEAREAAARALRAYC